MKRTMIGLGLAAAAAVSAVPALAQDGDQSPSPAAEATPIPVTTKSGRPDLYLEMPYTIGGFEPDIVMIRGDEHFANLSPDDPTRLQLEAFLASVGAETEDLVSGSALVSQEDYFAFIVGIRVDGVEPGTLLPAYLPILLADLEDASSTEDQVGGRDVTVVTSVGDDDEYVPLYVYDQGDTLWMVQGPSDIMASTLESLPDPLPAE